MSQGSWYHSEPMKTEDFIRNKETIDRSLSDEQIEEKYKGDTRWVIIFSLMLIGCLFILLLAAYGMYKLIQPYI